MRSTNRWRTVLTAIVLFGIVLASGGCSLDGEAETSGNGGGGLSFLATMRARSAASSKVHPWANLEGVVADPASAGVAGFLRGRIVRVDADAGFVEVSESEAARTGSDGSVVPFDDPRAVWQTLVVHLQVESVLAGDATLAAEQQTVLLGLATYPEVSLDQARKELLGLGDIVVPVSEPNAVFAHNPRLSPVLDDGEMLIDVANDGSLTLPLKDREEGAEVLGNINSIDRLTGALGPSLTS